MKETSPTIPLLGLIGNSGLWHNLSQEPGLYILRAGGALLVAVAALIVGGILSNRVRAALTRSRMGPNPAALLARLTRVTVWLVGLLWILGIFQVPFTALAAIVSVTALALSLSLQDLLKNLIAGIYLLAERPFHIGDCITVSGVTGVIDDIQMRVTYLHDDHGQRIVMPNQTVFTQVIVNNTVLGIQGASLTVEAPRSLDPEEIPNRVLRALSSVSSLEERPQPLILPISVSPDSTKWNLSFSLKPNHDLAEALLTLGKEIPEATISQPAE